MCPLSAYRGHPPVDPQQILNAVVPRYRPDLHPLPCRARIVWADDGEEVIEGEAIRWDPRDGAIYVQTRDRRNQHTGVWLLPADVDFTAGPHTRKARYP